MCPRSMFCLRKLAGASVVALAGSTLAGCGSDETQRTLPSVQVAMNRSVAPIFDDGELALYEVRLPVPLPVRAPEPATLADLNEQVVAPYPRAPWVTLDDVRVQLSWTLTNLDDQPHNVEVLVDPWNEFARYFPGLQLVDADNGEYLPNLSGIDTLLHLEATSEGEGSRRHGVFTFDDMDELARDFATVMNLLENPPPALGEAAEGEDGTVVYVNHAFAFQNHSERDALVKSWVPEIVAALTGFDLGLRTTEPASIAIEVIAELVDSGGDKLLREGSGGSALAAPERVITIGSAAPAP